jgi:micrococcal nuclease
MSKKFLIKTALFLMAFIVAAGCFAACRIDPGGKDPVTTSDPEAIDESKWVYVRDSSLPDFATMVTLDDSNIEADFEKTGKGLVTLEQHIDGDTVHFWNYSHTEVIKARFIAIDTPESTGRVEPWGKPASVYTKRKLKDATQIVLQSDEDGRALTDSNGRYLTWVWYKTSDSGQWRNLNIELLSEGLAMGKSSSSNRYGSVAMEALTSARSERLNLFSGKQDPLFYYGETIELTIKALVTNKSAYHGLKVRFEGLVTKESGGGIYVEEFDEDTQQYYGVYVYGGYASLAPKFLVPGYRLRITGTADNNENFGFQVSGLSFSMINPTDDDTQVLEKNVEVKPTLISAKDINDNEMLENTFVKLEGLKVNSIYTTTNETSSSMGAMTLTCSAPDGTTVTVRTVVLQKDGELVTEEYFAGKTMDVCGIITQYEGKPQLKLFTLGDVSFK